MRQLKLALVLVTGLLPATFASAADRAAELFAEICDPFVFGGEGRFAPVNKLGFDEVRPPAGIGGDGHVYFAHEREPVVLHFLRSPDGHARGCAVFDLPATGSKDRWAGLSDIEWGQRVVDRTERWRREGGQTGYEERSTASNGDRRLWLLRLEAWQ